MKPVRLVFALILFSLFTTGCKPKQAAEKPIETSATLVNEVKCGEEPSRGTATHKDPLITLSGLLENDCLHLKYSYSGGMEHIVDVYWNGQWAETVPPQTHLYVSHDAKGDAFDGIKSGKKSFNLKPLRYQGVGQVIVDVHAEGVPLVRINYIYPPK